MKARGRRIPRVSGRAAGIGGRKNERLKSEMKCLQCGGLPEPLHHPSRRGVSIAPVALKHQEHPSSQSTRVERKGILSRSKIS